MIRQPSATLKFRSNALLFVVAFVAAALPSFSQQVQAQAQQATQPAAQHVVSQPAAPAHAVTEEQETAAAPSKPGHEGLKVHGHWKLIAKNPDGSIAKQVEFENSLLPPGTADYTLAYVLSGAAVIGEWEIQLTGTTGACSNTCELMNNTATTDNLGYACSGKSLCVAGLTTTVTPYTAASAATIPTSQLTFSGNFTAPAAGNINIVGTANYYCLYATGSMTAPPSGPLTVTPSTASPATCKPITNGSSTLSQPGGGFTGTTLATPFTFVSGQIVQVSVTITFS